MGKRAGRLTMWRDWHMGKHLHITLWAWVMVHLFVNWVENRSSRAAYGFRVGPLEVVWMKCKYVKELYGRY